VISSTAAIVQCENLMAYMRANNFPIDLSLVMANLKEKAVIKQLNTRVQSKLTEYLTVKQTQQRNQTNPISSLSQEKKKNFYITFFLFYKRVFLYFLLHF
jgi:hypothetical protein